MITVLSLLQLLGDYGKLNWNLMIVWNIKIKHFIPVQIIIINKY